MTVESWLKTAVNQLKQAGNISARLDAELLLSAHLQKPREYLLAHSEIILRDGRAFMRLGKCLERRLEHEPMAYILGHKEFYGREFEITPDVLVPRPESEAMIDMLKQIVKDRDGKMENSVTIADIGTGSGCLAVTAKLELPSARVITTDTSKKALMVARMNASKQHAVIEFFHCSLLKPLFAISPLSPLIIIANLPYIPVGYPINQEAQREPEQALFGGADGLDLYRQLFQQASQLSTKPAFVLTEALLFQHDSLLDIARACGFKLQETESLIQTFK